MSDFAKLIDNKRPVSVFKNDLGTYTAFVLGPYLDESEEFRYEYIETVIDNADKAGLLTDGRTPEEAVKRLAEKVFGLGAYGAPTSEGGGDGE